MSKSSVSGRYVAMMAKQLTAWLTTPLGDRHFPIVMIDGIHLGDHVVREMTQDVALLVDLAALDLGQRPEGLLDRRGR